MKKGIIITIIIVSLIMLMTIAIKLWPKPNKKEEIKIINKISDYGYVLEANKTKLHKQYFDDLVKVLDSKPVNEEEYVELVVKLFISDFYDLNSKVTKNDVGGIQYIYNDVKENMILKAKDTIYKYIENNIDNTRKQKLPIVKDVIVGDIKKVKFNGNDKKTIDNEAYEITATWTYVEDLGYQKEGTLKLVHENNKLSIVELK